TTEDTMTSTPDDPTTALPGRPPVVDLATWQTARDELLVREKAHTREGDALAAARRRPAEARARGGGRGRRPRRPGPVPGPVPGPRRARGLPAHVVRRRAAPGAVRGLHHHGLAPKGRRLPQRPRRLVRNPDLGPVGRGGLLRRVHGLHPALVLGAGRGGADRHRRGAYRLLPARRRPGVPHLLHHGPWQRAGQRVLGPARHDALRPQRGVGVHPRGLARGPSGRLAGRWAWLADLLVLALGRRRRRHLGPDQPARAAGDPPRRAPRRDPRARAA